MKFLRAASHMPTSQVVTAAMIAAVLVPQIAAAALLAVAAADNLLLTPDEFDHLEARQNLRRTMGRVMVAEVRLAAVMSYF